MTSPAPLNSVLFAFSALLLLALGCSTYDGNCPVQEVPDAAPVLLEVNQDPETLEVIATFRDESSKEQWFALERMYITDRNLSVVVGTSEQNIDRHTLPVHNSVGGLVQINDRGIFDGDRLRAGTTYAYTVRAWNCWGASPASNGIRIVALGESLARTTAR